MGRPEAYVEDYLRKKCKQIDGCICYKWVSPGINGVPDDIVFIRGKILLVECKSKTGRCSPLQDLQHQKIADAGTPVYVVHTREAVDDLLAPYEKRRYKKAGVHNDYDK